MNIKFKGLHWAGLILSIMILTSCSGLRLKDALSAGNFETIRYASHFQGQEEPLTREQFAEYKDLIVDAIMNNGANGITLKNTLKGELLYISPFQLTITDLSPDLKLFVNGKELPSDFRTNKVETILNPGINEIKLVLTTTYLNQEKVLKVDTTMQPSRDLVLESGFGFRTLIVTAKEAGTYLNINGQDYMQLNPGVNRIGYIPSVPLTIKGVALLDPALTSQEFLVDRGMDEISLALTERATTQPIQTGSTQVITQPVKQTKPGSTQPPVNTNAAYNDPVQQVNLLLQAYISDLNLGNYKELESFVQSGSALEKQWKAEVIKGRGSTYIFLGTENPKVTQVSDTTGYVDINTRIRVFTKAGKTTEPFLRYRYYFNILNETTLIFYQELQL